LSSTAVETFVDVLVSVAPAGSVCSGEVAAAYDATPEQVALAWLLECSDVILPIPGTSSARHLEDNVAAADLELTPAEVERLS
jgi:aryl-alcohol dehydrogenase-like predicted oxidoreductase